MSDSLQHYEGQPRTPQAPGEKSRWQRFLEWAMPSLRYKYAQAERVAEAEVIRREGEAMKAQGEGRRALAEAQIAEDRARQIGRLSMEIESQLIEEAVGEAEPADQKELEREMKELMDRIDQLSAIHGTEFGFSTGDTKAEAEDDE